MILWLSGFCALLWGSPFAQRIAFTQPDGTAVEIWGEGDEFHAIFETLDGYSVVFDERLQGYCFARLSPDAAELVSTGVLIHQGNGEALGLAKHLRISRESRSKKAKARHDKWLKEMELPQRWQNLKDATRQADMLKTQGDIVYSPPTRTTLGTKVGLTLLIDFDDDPATIQQTNIEAFCNADDYTDFGNNGSVRMYYLDNSDELLTYSNVVTLYIRIPNSLHPKSYYNVTTNDCGAQGRLLIADAIAVMKAMTNFNTDILPAFNSLTTDGNNNLVACNVYYAGGNGGVWSKGLWPHSSSLASPLEISPGGKRIFHYQMSNIGSTLELSTFCHENGHMLCGFPDIYDYNYDSEGGAGRFCLMDYGTSGLNPCQFCAYLKRAAGWATTVDLNNASRLTGALSASGTNFNHFYRYAKPGVSTEYFLLENRQKTGRDLWLPGAGIAIWHIDELGDKDQQNMTNNTGHFNYEVTLVQADNQWHFQRYINAGDDYDLYYADNTSSQYKNQFTDNTLPSAHWWSGSNSLAQFRNFSSNANTMTFVIGEGDPYIPVEAEAGVLTPPMASFSDDPSSWRGAYISSPVAGQGTATFSVNVPVTGQYVILCRVLVTNANENAFYVSVDGGSEDTFDVEAPLTNLWQWVRVNGQNGTGVPLTLNPRSFELTAGSHVISFRCKEANSKLDRLILTSDMFFVPNDTPPVITSQPQGMIVSAGGRATFSVEAQGYPCITYQWLSNGVALSGGTNAEYSLTNLQTWESGNYSVAVGNLFGTVTSQVAVLNVLPIPGGWTAFNDHYAAKGTHSNATAWNVFGAGNNAPGNAGLLKDIATGALLPVTLTITNINVAGATTSGAPSPGTPAYEAFNRFVDFGSGTYNHAIQIGSDAVVGYTFTGLNPAKTYTFCATAVRGGAPGSGGPDYYSNRWTRVELADALSFTDAHTSRVLTSAQAPEILTPTQVAFNTGCNTNGEMVMWDNIVPSTNGSFTVYTTRYTNSLPNGGSNSPSGYSYAFAAIRLEEVSSNIPPYLILPPRGLTVVETYPVTFSVIAAGKPAPYTYQWLKDGGTLPLATNSNFAIPATRITDAGAYSVIVSNSVGSVTSQVATLVVTPAPLGWVAFNDHGAGSGTHSNATRWNAFGISQGGPGFAGPLKSITSGINLPVILTIINSGATAGTAQNRPAQGSPAYNTFNSYVDFQGSNGCSIELPSGATVTYRFMGLNPFREYNFAGTAVRGDPTYSNRWSLFELSGADSWVNAHTPHVYTNGLTSAQVAINTGVNNLVDTGDMAVWEHIHPGRDGVIEVICRIYNGPIPWGTATGTKGYAMTAIRLEELPVTEVAITQQPSDLLALVGDTVRLEVGVSGTPPFGFQWVFNGTNIIQGTNATLLLSDVQTAASGDYWVVISNSLNSVTSTVATLTVIAPPVIVTNPLSQTVVAGEPVTMTVAVTGSEPLSFQWRRNGVDLRDNDRISGTTTNALVISTALRSDAGEYAVFVNNVGASALSTPAILSVAPLKFLPSTWTAKGQIQLSWYGEPGLEFKIEASTNFISWEPLAVITNAPGETQYIDMTATNYFWRFYRAVPSSP